MRLALLLGLLTAVASAQRPESELPSRAIRLLESTRTADKAWGAYLCGSLLVHDCHKPLLAELERMVPHRTAPLDGEDFFLIQSLLDALIRLRAEVPPELALSFSSRWRDEVTILLIPYASEDTLLKLEGDRDLTRTEWIAVSNRLLDIRSKTFFLRMVKLRKFEHYIEVYDKEPEYVIGGGIGDGIPTSKRIRRVPQDFPPAGVYTLRTGGTSGDTLLSSGPCEGWNTTSYWRTEITQAGTKVEDRPRESGGKVTWCADAYLAALRGFRLAQVTSVLRPGTKIRWTTTAAFRAKASAAMEKSARELRDFILGEQVSDLLPETGFRVTITPRVVDLREDKRVRLPELTPKTFVLSR